jgi:hypothetical protein
MPEIVSRRKEKVRARCDYGRMTTQIARLRAVHQGSVPAE